MPKMPLNIENTIDIELFDEILRIDSTSGSERELACFLVERLPELLNCSVETHEVGDGTVNLQYSPVGAPHASLLHWDRGTCRAHNIWDAKHRFATHRCDVHASIVATCFQFP